MLDYKTRKDNKMRLQISKKIFLIQNKVKNKITLSISERLFYFFLNLLAGIYYAGNLTKWFLYKAGFLKSHKAGFKVISIGNIKVGGTGKSPLAIKMASRLIDSGFDCALINRGYMGPTSKLNVISDGKKILKNILECSDEAYMQALALAGGIDKDGVFYNSSGNVKASDYFTPFGENKIHASSGAFVMTSRQRVDSINFLEKNKFEGIAILDDAFQYYRLQRDLNIVILDYADPFGGFKTFPAGMLRDRLQHLKEAHILVISKCPYEKFADNSIAGCEKINQIKNTAFINGFKGNFFYSAIKMTGLYSLNEDKLIEFSDIDGSKVFLFSALGDNSSFFNSFAGAVSGYSISCSSLGFLDHYNYSIENQKEIIEKSKNIGSDIIVTTFKDAVKLNKAIFKNCRIYAARFEVIMNDENNFFEEIKCQLNR